MIERIKGTGFADWPEEYRVKFEAVFRNKSEHQKGRLRSGLGRWLAMAEADGTASDVITPNVVAKRTAGLRPEAAGALRQALQGIFPAADVFGKADAQEVETPRASLEREIARNWHRLPENWQKAAAPKLRFDPDGLDDGVLVEAWATETLRSRLQCAWPFFDFCRNNVLPVEVCNHSVTARLDERQERFRTGDISLAAVLIEIEYLQLLGKTLFPERNWRWMNQAIRILKKQAKLQPTRNNGRTVELPELKIAAKECGEVALRTHQNAKARKKMEQAHTLARTGLSIAILVNSPIRLNCLATLDLRQHFNGTLTELYLSAQETKDGKRDARTLSADLRLQLMAYLEHHRSLFAREDETRLFVGSRGKPCGAGYMSQKIGDLTAKVFKRRVTAQVIRNVVAGFIVSTAPEEAALAGKILNHSSDATTETYRKDAPQIQASRHHRKAAEKTARSVGANIGQSNRKTSRPRRAGGRLQRK